MANRLGFRAIACLCLAACMCACTATSRTETQKSGQPSAAASTHTWVHIPSSELVLSVGTEAGAEVLQQVVHSSSGVADAVKQQGRPDAIYINDRGSLYYVWFFYRDPPRTILFDVDAFFSDVSHNLVATVLADIKDLPRSVRRQTFGAGPMPPSWPITIPAQYAEDYVVPTFIAAPEPMNPAEFAGKYAAISEKIKKEVSIINDKSASRASQALARLDPSSKLPGFNWNLVVFRAHDNFAFSVPDGSLFLSDGLIDRLSDDELAAVLSHLMGHEAYGHDRTGFWQEGSLAEKAGVAAFGTLVVVTLAALATGYVLSGKGPADLTGYLLEKGASKLAGSISSSTGASPTTPTTGPAENQSAIIVRVTAGKPPSTHFNVYTRRQEAEANYAAAKYLAAIGVPPDRLFDALLKLSVPPSATVTVTKPGHYRISGSAEFSYVHTADRNAADLGRMLDTGMIR